MRRAEPGATKHGGESTCWGGLPPAGLTGFAFVLEAVAFAVHAHDVGVVQRRDLHSQARQLQVITEAPDQLVTLDAEKMTVVLDNLLSNAIDFSPDNGEIRLLVSHSEGLWRFECIDQGPGVAEEDRQRIFDPFVQGQRVAPAPRQGSGVGLSIVRELVRAMGGRVYLVPQERGAHFCVEIPDEQ